MFDQYSGVVYHNHFSKDEIKNFAREAILEMFLEMFSGTHEFKQAQNNVIAKMSTELEEAKRFAQVASEDAKNLRKERERLTEQYAALSNFKDGDTLTINGREVILGHEIQYMGSSCVVLYPAKKEGDGD